MMKPSGNIKMNNIVYFFKNNEWARCIGCLLLGCAIGAIFYPSKRIEERLETKHQLELKELKTAHSTEVASLQERLDKVTQSEKQYREETERKLSLLTTENKDLKSKQKTSFYKIIRPDGTIEIKKFTESEVNESSKVVTQIQEEFKAKIESIEKKWETIHRERVSTLKKEFDSKEEVYKKEIDTLKSSKVTEINKKSLGVEAGVTQDLDYYGHATYDLFGPVFVGGHIQVGKDLKSSNKLGVGLGLRF